MSDPRWTDETADRVAQALYYRIPRAIGIDGIPWERQDEHTRSIHRLDATAVLTALADAGLLLPPAGDTAEQWCIRFGDGTGIGGYSGVFTTEAEARAVIARHGPGATLMHRTARFWPDRHTHLGWYYPQWQPATQEAPHVQP